MCPAVSASAALRITALGCALGGFALPSVAKASAGRSIATAPTVEYGVPQYGGDGPRGGRDFWRLPVTVGDRVTFDVDTTGTSNYSRTDFRFRDPSITDYTVDARAGESGLGGPGGGAKGQLKWDAAASGLWTLWVTEWLNTYAPGPYMFTATVAHKVTLTLKAPSLAVRGETVRVDATVASPAGLPSGTCIIGGRTVGLSGSVCRTGIRAGHGKKMRVRAEFVPNDGWQAATAARTVRLVHG